MGILKNGTHGAKPPASTEQDKDKTKSDEATKDQSPAQDESSAETRNGGYRGKAYSPILQWCNYTFLKGG